LVSTYTIQFLKALKKNNNKAWFDANRETYVSAKNDFENLANDLLRQMSSFDKDMKELSAKNCLFRINRDIRFSKDKTPYKVNIGASFNKGGKKSIYAGYYFHLQPGGKSFAGGGLWMPAASELKKIRQEIDYCFPEFKKIINSPDFQKTYGELDRDKNQMLVNVPKGYEKENPAAEFLKLKSFVALKPIPDNTLIQPGLSNEILQAFKALKPLVKFINRSFE
jgi:uncharacterized protein (TIGR02453 family)